MVGVDNGLAVGSAGDVAVMEWAPISASIENLVVEQMDKARLMGLNGQMNLKMLPMELPMKQMVLLMVFYFMKSVV